MPIITLVEKFQSLFDEGYGEEDILEAFGAALERQYVNTDDEDMDNLSLLKTRVEDVKELTERWRGQNTFMD